jgi:diguanylate cyclase (GGDEF)-like protein
MMKPLHIVVLLMMLSLQLSAKNDPVTLQLRWPNQFQFAGFYVAKERGFYEEEGLDVTIREFSRGVNVAKEVVSQRADYGIGRSSLLLKRAQGMPVVALAAIYQESPSVLITADPDIRTPKDLEGRRIMITPDTADSAAILGMLLSSGVKMENLKLQPHSFDYRDLLNGKTDAMACYLSNEPYLLDENNASYTIFDPKNYGFDFYGDLLFTSEEEIAQHPERVKRFYEASIKGWKWAFEHIEETAELIYQKYNTQHKPLRMLIHEGEVLKPLAFGRTDNFGFLSKARFKEIAEVYKLSGLLQSGVDLDGFINPLNLGKHGVRIGILAKRGEESTRRRWMPLLRYLNDKLPAYNFEIVPLDFTQFESNIEAKNVDFIFTNTMFYVQLEHEFGISRIATLLNAGPEGEKPLKEFGGVIFTHADNSDIKQITDLRGHTFAAVSPHSFGGWVMGYEELKKHGLNEEDIDLYFLNTHDNVVYGVINRMYDAGTVRTDTLERMAREGHIDLKQIKVLEPKHYPGFPYLISTRLYPEWPLAKLPHTSDKIAHDVVAVLIAITPDSSVAKQTNIGGWTVPVSYSSVHDTLKQLHLPPYDHVDVSFQQLYEQYQLWIYFVVSLLLIATIHLLHVRRANRFLKEYNRELDHKVYERTIALQAANEQLKILARTDPLTQIHNRIYFMELAEQYYDIARRNSTPLQVLMLDIDHFKQINDTYGHQSGDAVLKLFAKTISDRLRRSDIFGRIGGEEFAIVLQNTSLTGAEEFAQRLRRAVEALKYPIEESDEITFTVSIGIAENQDEADFKTLLNKADKALYKAKHEGRNMVQVYTDV